ncbi:hypothetical protein RRF57_011685 [Xylaria bambusicola]|uniref:Uncharacterized protein n=1 Tax=Xylaria bambusicola TaxID=326684 RepID=A0AAN7UYI2_9PEZI
MASITNKSSILRQRTTPHFRNRRFPVLPPSIQHRVISIRNIDTVPYGIYNHRITVLDESDGATDCCFGGHVSDL